MSLIAVCEGLLACEDLQPGALGGTLFPKVLDIAKARFGWTARRETRTWLSRARRAPTIFATALQGEGSPWH